MELLQFEKEYTVHVYETGPDGRINLFSLFNYMQDIASIHAERLGFGRSDLMKENNFWVLSRMYAVINELPSWEDRILVRTRPCGTDKLFAMRSYDVFFPDGRPVASASSSWLIVDRTSKRIQRPGDILTQYNSDQNRQLPAVRNAGKLDPLPVNSKEISRFRVRISDLDINLHTNNVNYVKWVCDAYDLNFTMHHQPCSAEINYLAESMFNDEIIIRTSEEETTGFYGHSLFRSADNREICRIRLEWKEKGN